MAEHTCEGNCCGKEGGMGFSHHGHHRGLKALLMVAGSLYLLALFVNTVTEHQYIGRDVSAQTSISVSGDGEAYAAPDIATVSYAVTADAKTQTEASKQVAVTGQKIIQFLKDSGVADKDIKNTSYDLYPKYDYVRSATFCPAGSYCPPDGKQVLSGYTVTQSVDVKIRKLDDAGKILGGLTENGATNISGLSFTVENPDQVQADARKDAIEKAKKKADELAAELGVKLVRIVSFNEGSNYPVYAYGMGGKAMSLDAAAAPMPNLPAGENKFTSNVNIVYEIR